jgi:hypothetical protein
MIASIIYETLIVVTLASAANHDDYSSRNDLTVMCIFKLVSNYAYAFLLSLMSM